MKIKPTTVAEYIASFPEEIQGRLNQIRDIIKQANPGMEESIRYYMPAFKVGKEHLYLSACKNHIGLYPSYGLEAIEADLKIYRGKNTKDALHFLHHNPLPLALIEKIVIQKSRQ